MTEDRSSERRPGLRLRDRVARRLRWYADRLRVNNSRVGRLVELAGNRVWMDGMRFSVDTPLISRGHKSTLLFGLHEMHERRLVRRWLPSQWPVVECGGGLGVVSCLVNRRLEHPDKHVVVEANAAMIPVLSVNRDLNRCGFRILHRALAYGTDSILLSVDTEFVGSAVGADALSGEQVRVPAATLAQVMDEAGFAQTCLVCDIEGAEAQIVEHDLETLSTRVPFIMAELHPRMLGADVVAGMLARLQAAGYEVLGSSGDSVALGMRGRYAPPH